MTEYAPNFTRVVELRPGDNGDPDGSRMASILAAYFAAEEARKARRLLWRVATIIAVISWVVERSTPFLPPAMLLVIIVVLVGMSVSATIEQWRTEQKLHASLDTRVR